MIRALFTIDDELRLLPPRERYAPALHRIIREEGRELGTWLPWFRQSESKRAIRRFLRESRALNEGGQKLITFIFYGEELIGSIGLMRIDQENRKAEIGYWLRKAYRGRGITIRSALRIIAHAFSDLGLNRLVIKAPDKNTPSRGVPEKLGFQHEGSLRESLLLDGAFHDMEIYSLLKREWKKKEP
ncbi:MAG: GNAT family protein [Saprospiraceae bacterium]|nr:GNAT family protein [Saprospiraceae bacterium]